MQVSTIHALEDDRIDKWSLDLGIGSECSNITHAATCGTYTTAPEHYMADTPYGAIVMTPSYELDTIKEVADAPLCFSSVPDSIVRILQNIESDVRIEDGL